MKSIFFHGIKEWLERHLSNKNLHIIINYMEEIKDTLGEKHLESFCKAATGALRDYIITPYFIAFLRDKEVEFLCPREQVPEREMEFAFLISQGADAVAYANSNYLYVAPLIDAYLDRGYNYVTWEALFEDSNKRVFIYNKRL